MDAREILGILGHHLEKIVRSPRHKMTLHHIGHPCHRLFECAEDLVFLAAERDFYIDNRLAPDLLGAEKSNIPRDIAILFKPLDAPMTGRLRKVHPLGQLRIRYAPLFLKSAQDSDIRLIELH